jgi:hypothetical protein
MPPAQNSGSLTSRSGERGLLARSCRQHAGNIRLHRIDLTLPNSLGKLPRLAGWQPALPRIRKPSPQYKGSARVSRATPVGLGLLASRQNNLKKSAMTRRHCQHTRRVRYPECDCATSRSRSICSGSLRSLARADCRRVVPPHLLPWVHQAAAQSRGTVPAAARPADVASAAGPAMERPCRRVPSATLDNPPACRRQHCLSYCNVRDRKVVRISLHMCRP